MSIFPPKTKKNTYYLFITEFLCIFVAECIGYILM